MKKILSTLVLGLFMVSVPASAMADFSDVNDGTSYRAAIQWMADQGVIQGYSDGRFAPDACVNRAEFLKMLFLVSGATLNSSASGNRFPDVDVNAWYYSYVNTARVNDVIEGYPDGYFRPANCVNRAEAIKMAMNEFDLVGLGESDLSVDTVYSDTPRGAWYYRFLLSADASNLLGLDHVRGRAFYPGESMSRKEVAEMLYRIRAFVDNDETTYSSRIRPKDLERVNHDARAGFTFYSEFDLQCRDGRACDPNWVLRFVIKSPEFDENDVLRGDLYLVLYDGDRVLDEMYVSRSYNPFAGDGGNDIPVSEDPFALAKPYADNVEFEYYESQDFYSLDIDNNGASYSGQIVIITQDGEVQTMQ